MTDVESFLAVRDDAIGGDEISLPPAARRLLEELEAFLEKPIRLQVESLYTQEQYDVVLL